MIKFFPIIFILELSEAKLVAEYNLKSIGDFELIRDEYKVLYKEHFYSLKEKMDEYLDKNENVLLETYDSLFKILNDTKIDMSGEFVSIKYKLLKQLEDNKEDLMQVYLVLKYKISEIAYKVISYIDKHEIDKQSMYYLEYTIEQAMRLLKNVVPHNKHVKVLEGIKALPYMFLAQNEISY